MNKEEIQEALKVIREPITVHQENYKYFDEENYNKLLRVYENCQWFINNWEQFEQNIEDLQEENEQLKKQKEDVVANAKEKIKRYESYINDLKKGNYPSPTVRQERQELIFRIREQEDLLRMLGEIE